MSTKVLVTGANGQLAKTLQILYKKNEAGIHFTFTTKEALDITAFKEVKKYVTDNDFDYCINCAAYTNVEQAEKTPEIAFKVNAEAVKNLAEACQQTNTVLIHISTDYVFDGEKNTPYSEGDIPNPINAYGKSKLLGEQYIQDILKQYVIIRTSWLYSNYGKNFLKTIINNVNNNNRLKIITTQKGSPTSTYSLSKFMYYMITNKVDFGVYHFTDKGEVTWYHFAKAIIKHYCKEKTGLISRTKINTSKAIRPKNSLLNNKKRLDIYRNDVLLNNAIIEVISLL